MKKSLITLVLVSCFSFVAGLFNTADAQMVTTFPHFRSIELKDSTGNIVLSRAAISNNSDQKILLTNTDSNYFNAKGEVSVDIDTKDGFVKEEELKIDADNLAAFTNYDLIIDGAKVATLTTDNEGDIGFKVERVYKNNNVTVFTENKDGSYQMNSEWLIDLEKNSR